MTNKNTVPNIPYSGHLRVAEHFSRSGLILTRKLISGHIFTLSVEHPSPIADSDHMRREKRKKEMLNE